MEPWLLLDVRTLAFVSGLGGLLMGATMLGIYLAGMRERAVLIWAGSGLAFGCGYLAGHLLQTLPVPIEPWQAGALANALIGLGHGLVLLGVQRYLDRPRWTALVWVVIACLLASNFVFPELRESLRLRITLQSGWYILVDVFAGFLLWRNAQRGLEQFQRTVALVLFAYALFLVLRLGYAAFLADLSGSFVYSPVQIIAFLSATVFQFLFPMALVVMLFRAKQLELERLARHDPLTGMHNRLSLPQAADAAMRYGAELGGAVSVMLFDIDHFKRINDLHGHQAGDEILQAVAERIDSVTRESDRSFRIGGEEFLSLLPGANLEQARQVAERYRAALDAAPVRLGGKLIEISASFGVVQWRGADERWEDLMKRADQALYRAKRGGRNRVEVGD